MHFDQFENEEAHDVLVGLKSFQNFDAQLQASGLEREPVLEHLTLTASTETYFP